MPNDEKKAEEKAAAEKKAADEKAAAEQKAAEEKANAARAAELTKEAELRRLKWRDAAAAKGADPKAADVWPKLYGNINVPPMLIGSPEEADGLGSAWVEVDLASHGLALTPAAAGGQKSGGQKTGQQSGHDEHHAEHHGRI